jgi:glycerol-3-phosphate dehydrogenase
VLYALRRELAQTLSDVLLRRTMVGLGPQVGLDVDEAAAQVAVKHAGWSEERAKNEVEAYREYVERYKPKVMRDEAAKV